MPTMAGQNADWAECQPGAMPNIPIMRDHSRVVISLKYNYFLISAYSILVYEVT